MSLRATGLGMMAVLWMQAAVWSVNQSIVIIVNKANPVNSLTFVELRRIFMKQTRVWANGNSAVKGESIVPVDWEATSEIRKYFSKKVLGKSVLEMREFWVQQNITAGLTPPSTQKSARAILRFVASVPGAISYLPANEVDDSVKTVRIPGLE